jgi:hypothetical protein
LQDGLKEGEVKYRIFGKKLSHIPGGFAKVGGLIQIAKSKKRKKDLLNKLKNLDAEMEMNGMSIPHWQQRYEWENDLERIYHFEEMQWQRRGG